MGGQVTESGLRYVARERTAEGFSSPALCATCGRGLSPGELGASMLNSRMMLTSSASSEWMMKISLPFERLVAVTSHRGALRPCVREAGARAAIQPEEVKGGEAERQRGEKGSGRSRPPPRSPAAACSTLACV